MMMMMFVVHRAAMLYRVALPALVCLGSSRSLPDRHHSFASRCEYGPQSSATVRAKPKPKVLAGRGISRREQGARSEAVHPVMTAARQ